MEEEDASTILSVCWEEGSWAACILKKWEPRKGLESLD